MAIYRQIYTSFWTDSKVEEDFSPEDKYFYLYLLTNTHTNLCGCYEISKKQMSYDTGYSKETITELIRRMQNIHGVIKYSEDTKELFLLNWHKHNWSASEKLLKGVYSEVVKVKYPQFRYELEELLIGYGYPMDRGTEGERYPMDTSVTVTHTVTDTVNNTDSDNSFNTVEDDNSFIPPTKDEVELYCIQNGFKVDPEKFIATYQAQGWKLGNGIPMTDWKAALRKWHIDQKHRPKSRDKPNGVTNFSQTHDYNIDEMERQKKLAMFKGS